MIPERTVKQIVEYLVQLDESRNLDSLPEVQALRQIVRLKPDFDEDSISRLCVAAGLNDYQEAIPANPEQGSYWGRFVNWAVNGGEGIPPWRRFPNIKARRFDRFRNSKLWKVKLLGMDSGQVRVSLAEIMKQNPLHKTICFAPLVLARWAYVLNRPFTVVSKHPIPMDSRVSRFLESVPGLDPHSAIDTANETRRTLGRRELNMSDFDAWAWQSGS
jgi:N-glycosylase/DNA lyase